MEQGPASLKRIPYVYCLQQSCLYYYYYYYYGLLSVILQSCRPKREQPYERVCVRRAEVERSWTPHFSRRPWSMRARYQEHIHIHIYMVIPDSAPPRSADSHAVPYVTHIRTLIRTSAKTPPRALRT